jgi:hypothetical protein
MAWSNLAHPIVTRRQGFGHPCHVGILTLAVSRCVYLNDGFMPHLGIAVVADQGAA